MRRTIRGRGARGFYGLRRYVVHGVCFSERYEVHELAYTAADAVAQVQTRGSSASRVQEVVPWLESQHGEWKGQP